MGSRVGRLRANDEEDSDDEGDILGPWAGAGSRKLRGSVSGAREAHSRAGWSRLGAVARHVSQCAPGQGFWSTRGGGWGSVVGACGALWKRSGSPVGPCRTCLGPAGCVGGASEPPGDRRGAQLGRRKGRLRAVLGRLGAVLRPSGGAPGVEGGPMGPGAGPMPARGAPAVSGSRSGPLVGRLGASADQEDGDEGDILGPWPGARTWKLCGVMFGAGGARSRAVWSRRGAVARHVNPRAPGQGF